MAPKAKRSRTPDSQFLFVNEDASTVTRTTKDAELDRNKQSHVQRQNFARRRRLRDQSDSGPATSGQGSVPPSPVGPGTSPQEGVSTSAHYFDILQNIDLGDPLFQSTSPPSVSQGPLDPRLSALFSDPFYVSSTSPPLTSQTAITYGPAHSYRHGNYFDVPLAGYGIGQSTGLQSTVPRSPIPLSRVSSPPNNTHRALEQWAPPLIKHYNTIILPEVFWKDTRKVSLAQFRHAPLIHADMQACMAEPAHMYALLASAAAHMMAREGRLLLPNVSEEDGPRIPAFFKTKAIQALRAKLASGQLDHHIAVDIHRLYAAGIHADYHEAAEPHFQALMSMIDALGGLTTFDDYQLEKVTLLDCTAALGQLGVPRLLMALDPGPLPEEVLSHLVTQSPLRLPPGAMLEALLETFHACAVLSQSFTDLIEVVRVSTYLDNTHHYVPECYKWFSWRTLIILHRLLSMPLHYELDNKADCARIATAFWTAILRLPTMGRRMASKSASVLRRKLENTDLGTLWQPRTDCLLWIAVFGGICCMEREDLDWYVHLARTAATEIGVENLDELEDLLTAFLYDPHSQRDFVVHFAARIWSVR